MKTFSTDEMRAGVRLARSAAGLTQAQLGAKARISQSQLSLFELGQVDLTAAELRRINRVLDKYKGTRPLSDMLSAAPPLRTSGETPGADEIALRRLQREAVNLSQSELAKRMGMRRARLGGWENGQLDLTPDEHLKWTRELSFADPYFRLEVANDVRDELSDYYKRIQAENKTLREEVNKLKTQSANDAEIAALGYAKLKAQGSQSMSENERLTAINRDQAELIRTLKQHRDVIEEMLALQGEVIRLYQVEYPDPPDEAAALLKRAQKLSPVKK